MQIKPEDKVRKVKVSCLTLSRLLAEAMQTDAKDWREGLRFRAGLGEYVRVPACECGTCAKSLAGCRKKGATAQGQPVVFMTCNTATRLTNSLRPEPEMSDEEHDRIADLVSGSFVIHQCKDRSLCGMRGAWEWSDSRANSDRAGVAYRDFVRYAPHTRMDVVTASGSKYELFHDGKEPMVRRIGSDSPQPVVEPLVTFYRVGDRLVVNDWFTTEVADASVTLLDEATSEEPSAEAVLNDLEQQIDSLDQRLSDLIEADNS